MKKQRGIKGKRQQVLFLYVEKRSGARRETSSFEFAALMGKHDPLSTNRKSLKIARREFKRIMGSEGKEQEKQIKIKKKREKERANRKLQRKSNARKRKNGKKGKR